MVYALFAYSYPGKFTTCNTTFIYLFIYLPTCQYISHICLSLFSAFCNIPDLIKQINSNFDYWVEEEKRQQTNARQPSSQPPPPPTLRTVTNTSANAV